jgi:endonuclease/exonuclease/phosphatase family metal-dependent hydrolase
MNQPVHTGANVPNSIMELVVATYNIHGCIGGDGRYDPERIIQVLGQLHADIIALQEVESHGPDGREFLNWLGHQLGYTSIAGPTLLRGTGDYGNALLTKSPVLNVRKHDLSLPSYEPRGALEADLDHQGTLLKVVATHLGLRPAERRAQVQQLLTCVHTAHGHPAILMGDINEWFLWGRPLRWLRKVFGITRGLRTFPARFPIFPLDRIWIMPREALVSLEVHHSHLSRWASDHLPLKATVRLR